MGILYALKYIEKTSLRSSLIATNSQNILNCLYYEDRARNHTPIIYKIKELAKTLTTNRHNVSFIWIPRHSDVLGNESADSFAKLSLLHPDPLFKIKCLFSSIKGYLKKEIKITARKTLLQEGRVKGKIFPS